MAKAIKVENLSKAYQLGEIGTGSLSSDIERWIAKIRGKEDPFLKIGETNDRTSKGNSDVVWSLKNISFDIPEGEAVGIIGRNGAGKSTLLKILSRVTSPTIGRIRAKGRIASLLEVGTGFHPELSGRENIFLNGAILGMRKTEIHKRFDEIVDFAGIERYVDTPVKRYSSGMYVRLAFAVAAHLESEILIVDEVLAVGDTEFQNKCLGKMGEISRGEGRTVLFVSHNMGSIKSLCQNSFVINNGKIVFHGQVEDAINNYYKSFQINSQEITLFYEFHKEDKDIDFLTYRIIPHIEGTNNFYTSKPIICEIKVRLKCKLSGLRIGFDMIHNLTEQTVFRTFHDDLYQSHESLDAGQYTFQAIVPSHLLKDEKFDLSPSVGIHNIRWVLHDDFKFTLNLMNVDGQNAIYADNRPGFINPLIEWKKD